jgi:hypothetical protein
MKTMCHRECFATTATIDVLALLLAAALAATALFPMGIGFSLAPNPTREVYHA